MLFALANTRALVFSSTLALLFITLDTVIAETPNASAICFNVTLELKSNLFYNIINLS